MGRKRVHPIRLTTNAERCKLYREKHKKKYQKADAQRKKMQRLIAATDPEKNMKRLKNQADMKFAYRRRKKEAPLVDDVDMVITGVYTTKGRSDFKAST